MAVGQKRLITPKKSEKISPKNSPKKPKNLNQKKKNKTKQEKNSSKNLNLWSLDVFLIHFATFQEQLLFSARRRARSALEKNSAAELKACSEAWAVWRCFFVFFQCFFMFVSCFFRFFFSKKQQEEKGVT